jgi:hypothetical protein
LKKEGSAATTKIEKQAPSRFIKRLVPPFSRALVNHKPERNKGNPTQMQGDSSSWLIE